MKPAGRWLCFAALWALAPTAGPAGARYDDPTVRFIGDAPVDSAGPAGARYDDHTTHVTLITRAVKLAARDGYPELETFRAAIKEGVVTEDSGTPIVRFANHFFDPTTGLGMPKNSYTVVYEGRAPSFGDTTRYKSAYEWGLNGMPDDLDWQGAIDAYDYTSTSRQKAYEALGHVVHLLQDMAQPDHATCRPHPGGYAHDTIAGQPGRGHGVRKLAAEYLFPENRIGFEALWKYKNAEWPEGQTVRKPRDLDDAFRTLALESQQAEHALGLPSPARGEVALGLRSYISARADPGGSGREAVGEVLSVVIDEMTSLWRLEQYRDFEDGLWLHFEFNAPIVPTIPWPATSETTPYIELGNKLLPRAEEYSAGLMQLFHEIVNPPPYVRSVEVLQEDRTIYSKRWNDASEGGHVTGRTLQGQDGALKEGKDATIKIRFGPLMLHDGKEIHEGIQGLHVWLDPETSGDEPSEKARKIEGGFVVDSHTGATYWMGTWPATHQGRLRIRAEDRDRHWEHREPRGATLDSQPGMPARARAEAGYPWEGYEPGDDLNHVLGAAPGGCAVGRWSPERIGTMYSGTWRGTGSHHVDDSPYHYTTTVEMTFRSLAVVNPWQADDIHIENFFVTFGGARGTYVFDSPARLNQPAIHLEGEVGASGLLVINPPEGTPYHLYHFSCSFPPPPGSAPDLIPVQGFVGASDQKACADGTLSGTLNQVEFPRQKTTWSFTYTPDREPPPHVKATLGLGDYEPQGIGHFITHVGTTLTPAYQSPEAIQQITAVWTETADRYGALLNSSMVGIQQSVIDLHREAGEIWLTEEPARDDGKYEAKVAELEAAVRDYWAKRKEADAIYADGAEKFADLVAAKHPKVAEDLRAAAKKLKEKGSGAFGSGD